MKINLSQRILRANQVIKAMEDRKEEFYEGNGDGRYEDPTIALNEVNLMMLSEYLTGEVDSLELETSHGTLWLR